ncbi:ATP-binding protein [Phenylobacterium sp.]|uniref:ATP-binding protein n=1 Tax=Phenylobacterium sp. TaxID=1871053 RepID=UPI00286E11E0|nr:ATP-binding protein [Phenylobacterium sp.]
MSNLLKRQPMLWAALEASQDCVKLVGLDGRISYVNSGGCRLLELDRPEDVLGQVWVEMWPESSRAQVRAAVANGAAQRGDRFFASCPTARGHLKHWDVVVAPLVGEDGEMEALLVTSRDVSDLQTARAEAEERRAALTKTAAALRAVGRVAKIGGWEISLESQLVDWSQEIWEILGGTPRPIQLDEAMGIYPEAERPRIRDLLAHAAATGERITFTSEVTKFDGTRAPIRVFGEPVFENGVCTAIRGAAQDITEAHAARRDLARAERRLRMAVEMAEILVYEVDFHERSVLSDGPEATFFERGLTYEQMWRDPFSSVDPRDRELATQTWADAQRTGVPYRTEYRVARADGKDVWAFSTCRLELDEAGRPLRLVGALQNITERKLAEQEMLRARTLADAANTAKSAFLANVSHEIRTPLNGILGMAQVMGRGELSAENRAHLEIIRRSGETLMATLNDVLDFSKIEAGKMTLEDVDFDLREAIEAACKPFELLAMQKDLEFRLFFDPAAEGVWKGDALRLRQVMGNLMSNAVKFTQRGGVVVQVARVADGVAISITDSGIGIPAERQAELFTKFSQADASVTRRFGGTGLGLAISRDLVGLMGGDLSLESEPGRGTSFSLRLPIAMLGPPTFSASGLADEPQELQAAVRILAAEDNPTNRLVLQALLEPLGAELIQVASGEEAVTAWEGESFDVVLMDIQMPGIGGVEAVRQIRRRERETGRGRIPIVALTANVMMHQVADYRAAGMDDYVAKPISFERLYEALMEALDPTPAAPSAATCEPAEQRAAPS